MPMLTRAWLLDTAERAGFTFAETFLGSLLLSGAFNLSGLHDAELAGVAAGLAVLKSAAASLVGSGTLSPASLAPAPEPPPVLINNGADVSPASPPPVAGPPTAPDW